MERYLTAGSKIKLKGIDGHYIIKGIIGRGSSCVVYTTVFFNPNGEKTEHLLKEFNPRCISLERANGVLKPVKNEDIELFELLCTRFKDGFDKQAKLRTFPELKNYTANIQNTYYDNGTVYIDMTQTNGKSYADVEEKSIFDLARRIKVLAQVIGNYHKHGYLHLDIKPNNIFVRPEDETCEDIWLFDFDSLVHFYEENGKCVIDKSVSVSYTTEYAPIELISASRRGRIGKATDIYEIGEIFFEKLMGRHSTALEHNTWFDYEYNISAPIFKNVNPKVKLLLDEFFRHTICNAATERYQTAEELIEKLDEIIEIAGQKIYLCDTYPSKPINFIGRENELLEIENKIQPHVPLFISGIGGIGKSLISKQFAHKNCKKFENIVYAIYNSNFKSMFCDDKMIKIHNFNISPNESFEQYFEKKYNMFSELANKKTLLVIDNYNGEEEDFYELLSQLNCCVLVTTRMDFSDINHNQISLNSLSFEEQQNLFYSFYYPRNEKQIIDIDEIIKISYGHTLIIEMLAKQMANSYIKPEIMLRRLYAGGFKNAGKERIRVTKDGEICNKFNAYGFIERLFDISDLTESQFSILLNLSLLPVSGIHVSWFTEWCDIDNYDDINILSQQGWLNIDRGPNCISLHPIIAEIMFDKLNDNICKVHGLLVSLKQLVLAGSKDEATFYLIDDVCRILYYYNIFDSKSLDLFMSMARTFYGFYPLKIYCDYFEKYLHYSLSDDAVNNAYIYNMLGLLYNSMDLFDKSVENYKNAIRLLKKYSLENEEIFSTVCLNIGSLYQRVEKFEEAKNTFLEILKNKHSIAQDILATVYSKLGRICLKCFDYQHAEQYFKESFKIRTMLFPEQNEYIAYSYRAFGQLYLCKGEYMQAIHNFKKASDIIFEIFGQYNDEMVEISLDLADSYYYLNDIDKALEYAFKALENCEKFSGDDNSRIAHINNYIGMLYEDMDMLIEAEDHYSLALEMWRYNVGDNHVFVAEASKNLGLLWRKMKDYVKAEKYLSDACNILQKSNITGDDNLASAYSALGKTYALKGDSIRAEEYYRKSLKIRQELLDPHDERIKLVEKRIEELKK